MKRGPDLSHYQADAPGDYNEYKVWDGMPDMKLVFNKADFIMIKLTEGTYMVDAWARFYAEKAQEFNKPFWYYHFHRSNIDPEEQCDFYHDALQDHPEPTRKGTIDLETTDSVSDTTMSTRVCRFAELGVSLFGELYSNRNFLDYKLTPEKLSKMLAFLKIHFAWPSKLYDLPEYAIPNRLTRQQIPVLQRSWWESYPGIKGDVDDNIYLGNDYDSWAGTGVLPGYPVILSREERSAIISLREKLG